MGGKERRNAKGDITQAAAFQSRDKPTARIEPNRKWFTNSRVIGQDALASFRDAMKEKASDPYSVLLKSNKLPMQLIKDGDGVNGMKQHGAKMAVESSPYSDTFGPKAQRKRVKLNASTVEDLAEESVKSHDNYLERLENAKLLSGNRDEADSVGEALKPNDGFIASQPEAIFTKGQR